MNFNLSALAVRERLVPDEADATERAAQHGRLLGVWVRPDLVRRPHAPILHERYRMCKRISQFLPTAEAEGFLGSQR